MSYRDKAIGGYFELELTKKSEYHRNAISLNSGRNAFEYILRARNYKKIYIPYFTCDAMIEPLKKLKIAYEFYSIARERLTPIFDFDKLKENEGFVFTNYFGIRDKVVLEMVRLCKNLIIDNSQAFYSQPIAGVDTFYSPRKFFGLPDGGYLYSNESLPDELEKDVSYDRFEHLLGRIEMGAELFYDRFKKNDRLLSNQPIKKMSILTKSILKSIDYEGGAIRRKDNYKYLHNKFREHNILECEISESSVPMVYPLLLLQNGKEVRKRLIENKIFIPTYWPNVLEWSQKSSNEYNLTQNLLCLPVDQRYGIKEMEEISNLI